MSQTQYVGPAIQQGVQQGFQQLNEWGSGLFSCFSDCSSCCYGFWCGPCLYGDNAKKVQGGGCCGPCCVYFITSACCAQGCYAMGIRQDIRQRGALQGSGGKACLAHTFCSACATCQDAREIKRQTAMGIPTNSQFIATAAPSQQVIMK